VLVSAVFFVIQGVQLLYPPGYNGVGWLWLGGAALLAGIAFYYQQRREGEPLLAANPASFVSLRRLGIGFALMLAGLALSGHMNPLIAAITLAAWLLVMGESFLGTWARSVFRMSFLGFGPTEMRILIAAGALMLLGGGMVRPFGLGPYRLFDVGGIVASAGLAVVFIVNAVRNTAALYREETRW
jgi:hypothetical protein